MKYEEFLIALTDTTPEQAYDILLTNPNHEYKRGYELFISKDAYWSYHYARYVIKGRFELGEENSISKDATWSYLYARDIIRSRFELGENIISKDAYYSYHYALDAIKGRFESGEEVIKNSQYKNAYAKLMKNPNFWNET